MTGLQDPIDDLVSYDVQTASPTDELSDIASSMRDASVDALLVRRRDDQIAVLTEYDIVTGVAGGEHNTWATDIMSREVIEVDASLPVLDAVSLMSEHRIRHLVVRNGSRVGILGLTDCVPLLLAALDGGERSRSSKENQ